MYCPSLGLARCGSAGVCVCVCRCRCRVLQDPRSSCSASNRQGDPLPIDINDGDVCHSFDFVALSPHSSRSGRTAVKALSCADDADRVLTTMGGDFLAPYLLPLGLLHAREQARLAGGGCAFRRNACGIASHVMSHVGERCIAPRPHRTGPLGIPISGHRGGGGGETKPWSSLLGSSTSQAAGTQLASRQSSRQAQPS